MKRNEQKKAVAKWKKEDQSDLTRRLTLPWRMSSMASETEENPSVGRSKSSSPLSIEKASGTGAVSAAIVPRATPSDRSVEVTVALC